MPSNADVNVTPAKTSVTGATSGYLKTSDGASSFEVVSQIPAADVEGEILKGLRFTTDLGYLIKSGSQSFSIDIPDAVEINEIFSLQLLIPPSSTDVFSWVLADYELTDTTIEMTGIVNHAGSSGSSSGVSTQLDIQIVYS